jgi:hypothetical protein
MMEKLLQSRKFMLALVAIVVQLLVVAVPDTRAHADTIGGVLFAIVAAVTMGTSLEDAVKAWATRPQTTEQAVRDVTGEVINTAFNTTASTMQGTAYMVANGKRYTSTDGGKTWREEHSSASDSSLDSASLAG